MAARTKKTGAGPVTKVLVANRGEIARRVLRTLRAMGIPSVAVYSDADAAAPHVAEADEAVRIGPAPSRESYLAIERLIEAARRTGADAVHPGYGFLSENAAFAAACADAGLTFIGPPAEAIRRMGSKIEAKAIMQKAGVPTVPGVSGAGRDDAALGAAARELGFPVLVKASAGGGGKGMRIVREPGAVADALAGARREALAAFGNDTLLLERYFDAPRHIEVQIFGDTHGNVIHLFERECSIQRRYQKIIEEAPSVAVDEALRAKICAAAVAAGKAIGYVGAGTVEFIMDQTGAFYFLEVNTRLQVEHPVTEAITGLDLVELQIRVARGEPLAVTPDELGIRGHAVEARLYAEDPANGFLPATGRLALWESAAIPGVRWDSGVARGSEVGVHYDPMLAKVIAHGETRAEATARLVRALRGLGIAGVTTNRDFLVAVLESPAFADGALDTHLLDRLPPETVAPRRDPAVARRHAIVAAVHAHERRRRDGGSPLPASIPSGWRNNRWRAQDARFTVAGEEIAVEYVAAAGGRFDVTIGGEPVAVALAPAAAPDGAAAGPGPTTLALEIDGVRRRYVVADGPDVTWVHGPDGTSELAHVPRFPTSRGDDVAGGCLAPMTGVIREVRVAAGDKVAKGTVLLVLEAMKMEHQMVAQGDGVVKEVRVEVGRMVDPDEVLIVVEAAEEE